MLNLALFIGATMASIDLPEVAPAAIENASEQAKGLPIVNDESCDPVPPPGLVKATDINPIDSSPAGETLQGILDSASSGRRSRRTETCDDAFAIAESLKNDIFTDCKGKDCYECSVCDTKKEKESEAPKKRSAKPYKTVRPKTIADASAMTIAEM